MLAAMLLASTNAFAEAVEIDGIWYNLVSKAKVAEVTKNPNIPNLSPGDYTGAVNIPDSVKYNNVSYTVASIGKDAFCACGNLTSISIPKNVTNIGSDCFHDCSNLTSVHITDLVAWCNISFYSHKSNPLYYAHHLYLNGEEIKDLVIPDNLTSIVGYAFSGCDITSITIPNNITSIGDAAFSCCNGITSIIIPASVTLINELAFSNCSSLTSVTIIGSGETHIEGVAFLNCTSLTSIIIGSGVTCIDYNAFANCPNLSDVYCYSETVTKCSSTYYYNPDVSMPVFENSYIEYATLHVPAGSVETYQTTEPWSTFGTIAPIFDEESSKPFPAGTYAKADLKRTFAEGWNTICLPFAIDNIEAAFGTGAKAYGFDDFADGELKFSQVTSLSAGTPYVIYVPAEITELIAFENIVVEESNTTSSNIDKNGACFRGTYAPVAAGEWTKNNSTDNIYGITPDGKIRKAGPEASILGLRAYFDIPAGTEVKGFVFENGATAITEITENTENSEPIYNLAGQRLNKAQKGINIVNGKKVLY